jgi:hypothetical protein
MKSSQASPRGSASRWSAKAAPALAAGVAVTLLIVLLNSLQHGTQAPGRTRSGTAPAAQPGRLHLRAGSVIQPRPSAAGWQVSYPIRLPAGYQAPTGIAADPDGAGVWFFASGGTAAHPLDTVFYWAAGRGTLSRYQLDGANQALQAGAQTPIAVTADGTAWIGDNRTLVSVNRRTGAIRTLPLPAVSVARRNSAGLPVPPVARYAQGFTDIDALAIAPGGDLVIARQFATELQVLNPASHLISSVRLPRRTELAGLGADIAGLGRGEVGAALYAGHGVHELGQYAQSRWQVTRGRCPAYAVAMTATAIAATGPGCVAVGTLAPAGPARLAVQPASATAGSQQQACAVPLGGGQLALCSRRGLAVARAGAGSAVTLVLGQIVGLLPAGPAGQAGSTAGGMVLSAITPGLMAPAGQRLWFVPAQGGSVIGLVSPRG